MPVSDLFDEPDWMDDEYTTMTFLEYEEAAMNHAIYDNELVYPVLGLVSEAGEVADKVKKLMRADEIEIVDPAIDINFEQKKAIAQELVDVLWYITAAAGDIGYDLDEIAQLNIEKLSSRKRRGRLKGSGDHR